MEEKEAMRGLEFTEFSSHEGESFDLLLDGQTLPLTLSKVTELPPTQREGGAFTLEWTGPSEPALPQGIYSLRRNDMTYEMFLVAIGQDRSATRYEAIFN